MYSNRLPIDFACRPLSSFPPPPTPLLCARAGEGWRAEGSSRPKQQARPRQAWRGVPRGVWRRGERGDGDGRGGGGGWGRLDLVQFLLDLLGGRLVGLVFDGVSVLEDFLELLPARGREGGRGGCTMTDECTGPPFTAGEAGRREEEGDEHSRGSSRRGASTPRTRWRGWPPCCGRFWSTG